MSREELKPCPMCGTPAHFFMIDDPDDRYFGGQGICCDTPVCAQVGFMYACGDDPRPTLAEIWNRRAQDVARAPLTDEQRNAIQECIDYLTPAAKEFSDLGLPGMGDSKHARCIRTLRSILAPAAPAFKGSLDE